MKKRGISLVSLMITMVVMVALISTVTISGTKIMNNNKKVTFATEIKMIQDAISTYRTTNNEFPVTGEFNLNVSKVSDKAIEQFRVENLNSDGTIALYAIDYAKLGITTLKYGAGSNEEDPTDIYGISKQTGIVYYAKGVNVGTTTYYTLTDDLKAILDISSDSEVSDGITFNVNTTEWTPTKVTTTVKIPSKYTDVSVLVGEKSYTSTSSEVYNVYVIDDVYTNYIINVSYKNNGVEKTIQYPISNVDTSAPVLTETSVVESIVESDYNSKLYLKIVDCVDVLSGIKKIKYDYSDKTTNAGEYFKNNGYNVYNNSIEIEKLAESITVYVEDNAGNYIARQYNLSEDMYAKLLERDYTPDNNPTEFVNGTVYTAYIPEGFYYVGGTVTTGVVISDNIVDRNKGTSFEVAATLKGNQFVWVPVNYIMKEQTLKMGVSSFTQLRTAWNTANNANEIIAIDVEYEEPYSLASAWEDLEYGEMFNSVTKYGGFYVARYEARDMDAKVVRTGETDARKVGSRLGKPIYNHVSWADDIKNPEANSAISLAHSMYKNSEEVVSHLIYGVQWDILMYWALLEGKDLSALNWGNYNSGVLYHNASPAQHTNWVTNNIYDLAGNAYEWTMESYVTSDSVSKVIRGGSYSKEKAYPVIHRSTNGWRASDSNAAIGFRVALYIK